MKYDSEYIYFPFLIKYAVVEGNSLWFMDIANIGLCHADITDNKIKSIYKIPETQLFEENKYYGLKIVNNKLILLPYCSGSVLIFHINEEKFSEIDLNIQTDVQNPICKASYVYDEMLYLFILSVGDVVVVDLKEEKITKRITILLDKNYQMNDSKIQFSGMCAYIQDIKLGRMIKFDIRNQTFEQRKLLWNTSQWQLMEGEGREIYLRGDYGQIAKWEWIADEPHILAQLPSDMKYYVKEGNTLRWELYQKTKINKATLEKFYDDGEGIWFVPFSSVELVRIDKITHEIKKLVYADEEEQSARNRISWGKYFLCEDDSREFLWVYSLKRNLIYKINIREFTYEEIKLSISKRDLNTSIRNCFVNHKWVEESAHLGILQLIGYVQTLNGSEGD